MASRERNICCWLFIVICRLTGVVIGEECSIKLADINTKTDVDMNKFAGIWYVSGTTSYVFGENTWTFVTHVLYVQSDGGITYVTSGHQKNIDQCVTSIVYMKKTGQSEYTGMLSFFNSNVQLKFLVTDDNAAEVLCCFGVQDDGTCKKHMLQFEIWSRSTNYWPQSDTETLSSLYQHIDCVNAKDLQANRQGSTGRSKFASGKRKILATAAEKLEDNVHIHDINKQVWENIYTVPFDCTIESRLQAFQYMVLHRIAAIRCESPSSAAHPPLTTDSCIKSPIDQKESAIKKKPSGELHSVLVGVNNDEKALSTSFKVVPGNNGYTYYVLSSHKREKVCSSIKVDKYQTLSGNHFLQVGVPVPVERLPVKLPSGELGLFLCYRRENGSCSKSQVQFLSRKADMINFEKLDGDKAFIDKTFCTRYNYYIDQTAGFCAVPDILANIITLGNQLSSSVAIQSDSGKDDKRPFCRLKDIPLQESLEMSKVTGLWYELVRTRSIVNNYDSSVVYFHLNKDSILHSTYTGAINNKCNPAITSSTKPILDTTKCSEMEITLDGPYGAFSPHPFKIVYNDGMYTVHYGCFIQDGSGNCLQAEASIYGRQPTIDNKTRQKLYAMFPSMCLSLDDLHETTHNVDCSSWVLPDSETEHNKCQVQDIPYQNEVSLEQMIGSWYIISSRNSNGSRIDLRREGTGIVLNVIEKVNGQCKTLSSGSIVKHGHEDNGDLLIAGEFGKVKPFYSMRIVYTDYNVAIIYLCWQENIVGHCNTDGTIIWILSKSKTMDSVRLSILESLLKLPCGDLTDLKAVTDHCLKARSCVVADIPVMKSLNKWKVTGIWYDIVRPTSFYDTDSGTIRMTIDKHGNIYNEMTTLGANETCIQALTSTAIQRYNKADGEFLITPMGPYLTWGLFTFKYLYTDYENVLIVYVCINVDVNGECLESGKRGRIMARAKTLSTEEKTKLMHYLEEACISPDDLVQAKHEVDCTHRFKQ